jgi:hypothetical protein
MKPWQKIRALKAQLATINRKGVKTGKVVEGGFFEGMHFVEGLTDSERARRVQIVAELSALRAHYRDVWGMKQH